MGNVCCPSKRDPADRARSNSGMEERLVKRSLPGQRVGMPSVNSRSSGFSYYNSHGRDGSGQTAKRKVGVADFHILRVLGKGAFGTVYLVRKKDSERLMAMKSLRKSELVKKNQVFNTKTEKAILQLNKSKFIVELYYAFQTKEKFYMVLEYMAGGELFFHLKTHKSFVEERVRFYAAEVVLALEYLHKYGIIYRDLKPENVLMDQRGHVKLADFGLSKKAVSADTFCGTPEYLAPEVLLGEVHDKAVDWWSLGVLIFEMIAGQPPFYSKDTMTMYKMIIQNAPKMRANFSRELSELLMGLLEKDRTLRLGSQRDAEDIKSMAFFRDVDWAELEQHRVAPPYSPPSSDTSKFAYFDPNLTQNWNEEQEFNEESTEVFSMDRRFVLGNEEPFESHNNLENFTYENPGVLAHIDEHPGPVV